MEQVLSSLTDAAQLDSGAVRKVFTLSGQPVTFLPQFFSSEDVFFVYGNERYSQDDFELEFEESKAIQSYKKTPGLRNGYNKRKILNLFSFLIYTFRIGPKPKMPKKELNRTYNSEENLLVKLSKDSNIILPMSLRQKYLVGRMIGDGISLIFYLRKELLIH